MAKKRRLTKIPTPAWEPARGPIGRRLFGHSPQFYGMGLAIAAAVVALGVITFAFVSDFWSDLRLPSSTAVKVEDTEYSLRYFSRRLRMYENQVGGPANQNAQQYVAAATVANALVEEEVVRRFAQELGVSATEEEIQGEIASRLGIEADDPDYDTLFQQELARSGFSQEQYLAMIEATILSRKVRAKLEEDLPTKAESVRYRQIRVADQATAEEIKQQLEEGADFAQLAQERSLDVETKGQGGEVGWTPRGVLDSLLEDYLFSLKEGEIGIFPDNATFLVLEVLERAEEREIAPEQRQRMAQRAYQDWVQEKRSGLEVKQPVLEDSDKLNWVIDHAF